MSTSAGSSALIALLWAILALASWACIASTPSPLHNRNSSAAAPCAALSSFDVAVVATPAPPALLSPAPLHGRWLVAEVAVLDLAIHGWVSPALASCIVHLTARGVSIIRATPPYVEAVVLSPWEVLGLCALVVCVYDIVGPRYRYVYYDDGRMTPTFEQQWKEYCRARREHREQRAKERRRWRSRMLNRRRRFWALKDVDFVVGADGAGGHVSETVYRKHFPNSTLPTLLPTAFAVQRTNKSFNKTLSPRRRESRMLASCVRARNRRMFHCLFVLGVQVQCLGAHAEQAHTLARAYGGDMELSEYARLIRQQNAFVVQLKRYGEELRSLKAVRSYPRV